MGNMNPGTNFELDYRINTMEDRDHIYFNIPAKGNLSSYTDNILFDRDIQFRYFLGRASFSGSGTLGKVTTGGWEGFTAQSSTSSQFSNLTFNSTIGNLRVSNTNYNDSIIGTCNYGSMTLSTKNNTLPANSYIYLKLTRNITNTLSSTSGTMTFSSPGYVWNNSMIFRANGSNIGFSSSYIYYNESESGSSYKYQILPSNTMYLRVSASANYYVSEGQSFYINRWKEVTSSRTPGGTRYTRWAYIKLTVNGTGTTIASANSGQTTSSNPPAVGYPNIYLYANTNQSGGTNGNKVIYVRKI